MTGFRCTSQSDQRAHFGVLELRCRCWPRARGSVSWITTTCWPSTHSPWRSWPSTRIPRRQLSTATKTISTPRGRGESRTSSRISIPCSSWARTTSPICACCAGIWSNGSGGFRVGYEGSQDWDLVLQGARTRPTRTGGASSPRPVPLEGARRIDRVVGFGQTLCGRGLASRRGGAPGADRRRGRDHDGVGNQLQPGPVGASERPAQGQRHRPAPHRGATTPLYREHPHPDPYPDVEVIVLDDGAFRPPMRRLFYERMEWLTVIENA